MGYTHYWQHNLDFSEADWKSITDYAKSVIKTSGIPLAGSHGVKGTKPEITDEDIWLNGVEKDSHETFYVARHRDSGFCKTERKPYDKVVVDILLYMNRFTNITVSSDGDDFSEGDNNA